MYQERRKPLVVRIVDFITVMCFCGLVFAGAGTLVGWIFGLVK